MLHEADEPTCPTEDFQNADSTSSIVTSIAVAEDGSRGEAASAAGRPCVMHNPSCAKASRVHRYKPQIKFTGMTYKPQ
jgi:hypothetical protein